MKYYSYNEYISEPGIDDYVETKSEEDIRKDYWPYWYNQMCKKFGKEYVDANYTIQDCIDDWVIVNWAWEVEE